MIVTKTRGIVLHHFPYNDTTHIVHLLTEEHGRMAFAVPFGTGKRAVAKRTLFQPLSILEIEIVPMKKGSLYRLKEALPAYSPINTPFDPVKTTIALFIAEVLYRSLHEEDQSVAEFYPFVESHVKVLDLLEESISCFPLLFLYQYLTLLGFRPHLESYVKGAFFDLREGRFTPIQPDHSAFINPVLAESLPELDQLSLTNLSDFSLPRRERGWLLEAMVDYLTLHTSRRSELKSLSVLQSLF